MRAQPLLFVASLCSLLTVHDVARACGACVAPPPVDQTQSPPPLVASHRMAMSISQERTILWDQITYAGNPGEFAWVLPVKPGARVELASDAWLDTLDAVTAPRIVAPSPPDCSADLTGCSVAPESVKSSSSWLRPAVGPLGIGVGCGDAGGEGGELVTKGSEQVDVVAHKSEGPYEMVILRGTEEGALKAWLDDHGYVIPEELAPVIDDYVAEGFDFAALRLVPGAGVQQMRPVRVVQPGASPTLPLRMVIGGAGPRTPMTLFVVGEGRYEADNMSNVMINPMRVSYDFNEQVSSYSDERERLLNLEGGAVWLSSFAQPRALFGTFENPTTGLALAYRTSNGWSFDNFTETYIEQAFSTGETAGTGCVGALAALANDGRRVVDPCDGDTCRTVDSQTEVDVRTLACSPPIGSEIPFDDLSQALVGMHPSDVWVSRLDANLSRAALANDLTLRAHAKQTPMSQFVRPMLYEEDVCGANAPIFRPEDGPRAKERARLGVAVGLFGLLSFAVARRVARLRKKEVA